MRGRRPDVLAMPLAGSVGLRPARSVGVDELPCQDGEITAAATAAGLHPLYLLEDPVAQMGGCRGLGHPGMPELEVLIAEVLEHPGAAAEQHRDEVDRQLVDEAGPQ